MTNRAWLNLITPLLAVLCCFSGTSVFAQKKPVQIGIILDGPSGRNEDAIRIFEEEITIVLQDEYEVRFPGGKRLVADWTLQGVRAAANQLMADQEVDLILGLGFLTSHELARRKSFS